MSSSPERPVALGLDEATPVIEIGHRHVVNRASHAAAGFIGKHGHVDDLGDAFAEHVGEKARRTELVRFAEAFAEFPLLLLKKRIAPNQFAQDRRGKLRGPVVAFHRWNAHELIAVVRGEARVTQIVGVAIPDDHPAARDAGALQAGEDRFHDPTMRAEVVAADGRDLDADPVFRRDQRAPGAGGVGLAGGRTHRAIHHVLRDGGIFLEQSQRIRILDGVNGRRRRWRRRGRLSLRRCGRRRRFRRDQRQAKKNGGNHMQVAEHRRRICGRRRLCQ